MSYLLDIIFATIIGGAIIVVITTSTEIAFRAQSEYSGNQQVQHSLTETTDLLEGEFRNMGFKVPDSLGILTDAQPHGLTFLMGRSDTSGIVDTIYYWLGTPKEKYDVQNDSIRWLHRRKGANGTDEAVGLVTTFNLRYFDKGSANEFIPPIAATDLGAIEEVQITMEVQNPYALYRRPNEIVSGQRSAYYSSSMWRQTRMAGQNLRR